MAAKKQVEVNFSDIVEHPEHAEPITASIEVVIQGDKFRLTKEQAITAREGFIALGQGESKFKNLEPEISDAFDAPECYVSEDVDNPSNGYTALREVLFRAYPGYTSAQAYVDAAGKDKTKREGGTYMAASGIVEQATKRVRQAIGFLYSAWKVSAKIEPAKREQDTPDEFMRDSVRTTLKSMAAPKSKQTDADRARAKWWMGMIDAAFANPTAFADILIRTQLNVAIATAQVVKDTAKQAGPVTTLPPEAIAALNVLAAAKLEEAKKANAPGLFHTDAQPATATKETEKQ